MPPVLRPAVAAAVGVVLAVAVSANQAREPVAHYPLVNDFLDATGRHEAVRARNAPLLANQGVFCNGEYVLEVGDGCDVQTPPLPALNTSAFTISARFLVPQTWVKPHPVIVGGSRFRWLVYELQRDGAIRMLNSNVPVPCSVKYRIGVWHEAAVTFDGKEVTLFLDGVKGCSANVALQVGDDNRIFLTNFANASTFYGVVRDLKVFDAVVTPSRRTPEPGGVKVPVQNLSPVDQFLAACPTSEQMSSIDKDLRLSFEADPTEDEPPACSAAQGSRNLSPFKKGVYNTLLLMRRLEFDKALPWTNQPLYAWFISTVRGIRFRGDIVNSSCCNPPRVLGIAAASWRLGFTNRWYEPALHGGLDGMLGVFVHEARHADGKPHTCGAKDATLEELGAWGVQHYLYRWLAEHTDQAFFTSGSVRLTERMATRAQELRRNFCR